jgi:hypothetical protein
MRTTQALADNARFAVPRKQVLERDSADRGRKHGLVPARHVDGEDLIGFVANHPVPGFAQDECDRNLDLGGIAQAKLFGDDAAGHVEEVIDLLLGYVHTGMRLDLNLAPGRHFAEAYKKSNELRWKLC